MSTIGLAIIARDEEANLPHLLVSIDGAFDQVALLDTGSADRTVEVFEEWAKGQDLPLGYKLDTIEWCDDFAAARNAADELLETDWLCWADCDDEIVGVRHLHQVIAQVPPAVAAVRFAYDYAHDPQIGICWLERERLVRRGAGRWTGRLHETQLVNGATITFPHRHLCRWVHRRAGAADVNDQRDLRIVRRWVDEEPENPRPLAVLAGDEILHGDRDHGIDCFHRYLGLEKVRAELTAEQLTAASWALEGLQRGVDETYPDLFKELLHVAAGRPLDFWDQHRLPDLDLTSVGGWA